MMQFIIFKVRIVLIEFITLSAQTIIKIARFFTIAAENRRNECNEFPCSHFGLRIETNLNIFNLRRTQLFVIRNRGKIVYITMYYYIKEFDLMREVLFALQGLNGRIIRQDADGRFTITKTHISMIDPTQRMLLEKLTSFGWLVNKIKNHINAVNKDPTLGKVSQCLAAALNNELLEYYHLVTQIEQQLQKCANNPDGRTRASTPTSELYGCVEVRPPKPSATYESLQTALVNNGYNNHDNSDDGFGSQLCSAPSSNASPTVVPFVTLHQIHVWSLDHYFRLKTLAMLVDCCRGARGGHLVRIVYRFMQQGDKHIRSIITRILSQIVLPIRHMLSQWIFHGEILDPYDEFFICLNDHVPEGLTSSVTMMSITSTPKLNETFTRGTRIPISSSVDSLSSASIEDRHYTLNDYMMPGFISRPQANKILATGKAILLLRRVGANSATSSVAGYDDLKKSFESTNIESLFRYEATINCGEENEFEHLLNTAYKEVSQKVLELLFDNYKLRSHFRGLRQYLLLGQGDFIRHLMDLLKVELDKPSADCKIFNISSVLETARRSTNAQFDEPDVIDRLDCRLLDAPLVNACGWDIFSLSYRVDGPISVIFTEEKIRDYIEIFRQLWRTKRVEHALTSLWSSQMHHTKLHAQELPLLSTVFHRANILLTDMIHYMQHFQNFIMFEVVECSWVELVAATDLAKDLDDVIAAHDSYLEKIKSKIKIGTMCQKDIPFECILEFQQLMTSLYRDIEGKLNVWSEIEKMRNLSAYQSKIIVLSKKFQHCIKP